MKKSLRFLSIILALALALSLMVMPVSAAGANKTGGNRYQTVFIHGLFGFGFNDAVSDVYCYWGMNSGSMINYLNGLGYDVVNASVGPISSCWDRCCELFAQLTGTRTDYGAAHSSKVASDYANSGNNLKHDRYGRDYTGSPLVDNWGPIYKNGKVTGWYDNKLNLIGHSFGGPTSIMLTQLLAYGDADEIAWGKQQAAKNGGDWHDYVSPLFWGDYNGQYLINSITSLAGVLNGTTYHHACDTECEIITSVYTELANTLGRTAFSYIYDFQLEHFGITTTPGTNPGADDIEAFMNTQQVSKFLDGYDNAIWDLSISGCNDLKQGWKTFDNIYYFAYSGDLTNRDPVTGNCVPDPLMSLLVVEFSAKMGLGNYSFEQVKDINGNYYCTTDSKWLPNDGLVNTISERYPFGAAQKPMDADNIEKGIWQWKDLRYDHLTFCGGLLNPNLVTQPDETRRFYKELMSNIEKTSPVNKDGTVDNTGRFADVPKTMWCHNDIEYVADKGFMIGVSDTMFKPTAYMSRAQLATVLYRMAGSPSARIAEPFTDVPDGYWAQNAISWAYNNGIVEGTTYTTFAPNSPVTRAQLVTMLYRYAFLPKVNGDLKAFSDAASVPAYANDAFVWATQKGIIRGYENGTIGANIAATRGEMATIIARFDKL